MSTLFKTRICTSKLICGSTALNNLSAPVVLPKESVKAISDPSSGQTFETTRYIASAALKSGPFSSTSAYKGINVSSRRFAHTDVSIPNFDEYRVKSTLDPTKPSRETEDGRRAVHHGLFYGCGIAYMIAAKEAVQKTVAYKWMAADQKALASTVVDLTEIPVGQTKVYEWQGKPIFVKHRTANEVKREQSVQVNDLRHPEHDNTRVQQDEWLVVIGVCTHLGCIPIIDAGDFGGSYCPCHGSHYDGSGRIRKGPAPMNLEVPKYTIKDNILTIG